MYFNVSINIDNAAFQDNPSEISRILRNIADDVEDHTLSGKVSDFNGNYVGYYKVER
jgi:protocatechuate 3,4-dioxygenase beta subunit